MVSKNSNFNAVFGEDYLIDTSIAVITVTLPSPVGSNDKNFSFKRSGANNVVLIGQNVNGMAGLKIVKDKDMFIITVIDGAYQLTKSDNYFFSPTKLWRFDVDDSGIISTTQAS